jgi:hypothetical protein
MIRFRALEEFFSPEMRSQYCAGMIYSIRPQDALLMNEASNWLNEGKIEIIEAESKISGTGKVG